MIPFEFPFKVVLADGHAMFRGSLRRILEERPDLFKVVGEATNGVELLNILQSSNPNLAILDIAMPALSPVLGGIEGIRQIKTIYPELKVIVLTMHKAREYVEYAMKAGADCYLLKDDDWDLFFSAIEAISKGELFFPPILKNRKRRSHNGNGMMKLKNAIKKVD